MRLSWFSFNFRISNKPRTQPQNAICLSLHLSVSLFVIPATSLVLFLGFCKVYTSETRPYALVCSSGLTLYLQPLFSCLILLKCLYMKTSAPFLRNSTGKHRISSCESKYTENSLPQPTRRLLVETSKIENQVPASSVKIWFQNMSQVHKPK